MGNQNRAAQWFSGMASHSFITATGVAAFLHSTWAVGTLFAGDMPATTFSPEWWGWVVPAAMLAFSVDVGQIATSVRIKNGERSAWMYVTFFVLALATYMFQWVYMVHHMPELALGAGIRAEWADMVTLIRDASIWLFPALLPVATVLYTLSGGHKAPAVPVAPEIAPNSTLTLPEANPPQLEVGVELLPFGHSVPAVVERESMPVMLTANGSTANGSKPKGKGSKKANGAGGTNHE